MEKLICGLSNNMIANPTVDPGEVVNVCMPGYGGGTAQEESSRTLRSVTEGKIDHHGRMDVMAKAKTARGKRAMLKTSTEVTDVKRPVWSVSATNDARNTVWFAPGSA